MKRLHLHVAETVRERGMWQAGQRVVVAVSGGIDSVCLLHCLVRTKGMHGGRLSIGTINHGTRGEQGADDAAWVQALGASLGLEVTRWDLHLGERASEAHCREARYGCFAEVVGDVIALGHHGDDLVETSVMGWMRGSGTAGLAGMPWSRARFRRPMLNVGRAAIVDWMTKEGLSWREDPSNASTRFLRNRVRSELLPLFEELRPGSVRAMARGAGFAAEDDTLLRSLALQSEDFDAQRQCWPLKWFAETPRPLVRRALLARVAGLSSSKLDALFRCVREGSGQVQVTKATKLLVSREGVFILPGMKSCGS